MPSSARPSLLAAAAIAMAALACNEPRPPASAEGGADGGATADLATCTRCHGDASHGNAAPPFSLHGAADASDPVVGAHQAHLTTGPLRGPIACNECHVVPSQVSSPGHMDGVVELTFGALATTGGVQASFDPATRTCAVYCHGATLPGGALTNPVWNKGSSQAACGSCHGIPPPPSSGHPDITGGVTACSACHPATVKPDGTIDVAGGKHMNGTIDLAGGSGCTGCHGDPDRAVKEIAPAPPRGTHGETSTSARAVGAHQTHLTGGAIRAAVACTECHVLPTKIPHSNGKVDLTFGPLATAGGATPSFDGTGCNSVYCHGATLNAGGSITAPIWTKVDGTQNACGACHAIPPPTSSGHPDVAPDRTVCAGCHPATVKADGTIDTAGGKHINGTVDVTGGGCTACHGDPDRTPAGIAPAPPRDTKGQTASDAVGAHQAHLNDGPLRSAIACTECHVLPTQIPHSNGKVDLTWGPLATAGGVSPSFNPTTLTCTNYCHGATLPGGTNNTPVWNGGSAQAVCGSCHGLPPPTSSGHPFVSNPGGTTVCSGCHPDTVTSSGTIDVAKAKHMNGAIEVANLTCTTCHGGTLSGGTGASGANPVAAAPPRGTKGETSTSDRAVGMHAEHLTSQRFTTSVSCEACHVVPTSTSHRNGTVAVTFRGLATTGGATPIWNGASCSATYCHGNFPGGANATMTWANATVPAIGCTSCHGDPPLTGRHTLHVGGQGIGCNECHGAGYTAVSVVAATHVNGQKDTVLAGFNGRTCTLVCHGESHVARLW
jgi:predicted CxxxxCH...CXXCH cytochrome family protein